VKGKEGASVKCPCCELITLSFYQSAATPTRPARAPTKDPATLVAPELPVAEGAEAVPVVAVVPVLGDEPVLVADETARVAVFCE
jgi:hypothetical protein